MAEFQIRDDSYSTLIQRDHKATQFVAGYNLVPAYMWLMFHVQTIKSQQALEQHIRLLNGQVRTRATMIAVTKAHHFSKNTLPMHLARGTHLQGVLSYDLR